MKKSNFKKVMAVVAVIAITGFGVNAFAGWDMGSGHHGMMEDQSMNRDNAQGYHQRGFCKDGKFAGLSEEELKALRDAREGFFKDTEDLRRNIQSKNFELKSELVKKNPDVKKASEIQKALSDLEAKFAQKRLVHHLEMREFCPNAGQGFMMIGFNKGHGGGERMGCR
ncbi:MAG: periplasmic heavy metal sensor [Desulfobacterales bacterium]|nr:periplasmic heavy metal sensor [Desulfobacterales bacterium]